MFVNFFLELKQAKVPVSLTEYLDLLEGMDKGVAGFSVDDFYYLSRATLVKDERNIDKFDRVFGPVFKGLETVGGESPDAEDSRGMAEQAGREVPDRGGEEADRGPGRLGKAHGDAEEAARGAAKRHQGGSKWIGTAGTSPFGAYGYNPEGVRIGQDKNRHRRAVKVWDKREFKNSTTRSNSVPATSRSRCAACASSRAKARRTSSISTTPSGPPRAMPAGSTSRWARSGTTR